MRFELQVLGANSATPMPGRFASSFVLYHNSDVFLLDCGEGAQIKMSEFKVKRSKINYVFISHLHGDHIFGLPGFLNSYNLNGRERKLTLIGPIGLSRFIDSVCATTGGAFNFELEIIEIDFPKKTLILTLASLEVFAFPMKHRLPTFGYLFKEKVRPLNINPDSISKYELSIKEIVQAKNGQNIFRDSQLIINKELTFPPAPLRSFAYCSDTVYDSDIVNSIVDVDLLYHEATYLHDLKEKAKERMHSTAHEAATIAIQANANKLLIGHYSSRYKNLDPLLMEARKVFEATELAEEGKVFKV